MRAAVEPAAQEERDAGAPGAEVAAQTEQLVAGEREALLRLDLEEQQPGDEPLERAARALLEAGHVLQVEQELADAREAHETAREDRVLAVGVREQMLERLAIPLVSQPPVVAGDRDTHA